MKEKSFDRRLFLKSSIFTAAALAAPLTPVMAQQPQHKHAVSHVPIPASQIIDVSLRSNLYDDPINVFVSPGEMSAPIKIGSRGTYRIKVDLGKVDVRFGQVFRFTLADAYGNELSTMNLGNSATGTFLRYGVQVYLLSIQQGR